MNNVYFACSACRVYVDAGYRHAYWALEDPGIVNRQDQVDSKAVIETDEYWAVDAEWLMQLLPAVRRFLLDHGEHGVRFGDSDEVALPFLDSADALDWLMEAGFVLEEGPRYWAERLGLSTWDEVVAHVDRSQFKPSWWSDDAVRQAGRQKFTALVVAANEVTSRREAVRSRGPDLD